eukprot:1334211-Pleurochrysis_carterae.AAC.1
MKRCSILLISTFFDELILESLIGLYSQSHSCVKSGESRSSSRLMTEGRVAQTLAWRAVSRSVAPVARRRDGDPHDAPLSLRMAAARGLPWQLPNIAQHAWSIPTN